MYPHGLKLWTIYFIKPFCSKLQLNFTLNQSIIILFLQNQSQSFLLQNNKTSIFVIKLFHFFCSYFLFIPTNCNCFKVSSWNYNKKWAKISNVIRNSPTNHLTAFPLYRLYMFKVRYSFSYQHTFSDKDLHFAKSKQLSSWLVWKCCIF